MRIPSLLVVLVFAVATYCLWGWVNRPTAVPPWPEQVSGYAFSPFRQGQDALINVMPSVRQIEADIALLADEAHALRTYSSLRSLAEVPGIAARHGMEVALGIWLGSDEQINREELAAGVALANAHDNVTQVMVGNETVLRGEFDAEQMSALLAEVRSRVSQPVSTAEPWHVWLRYPQLANNVDFLTVHMLPYWEGIHVDAAIDYIVDRMEQLQQRFPDKPIVIGEVGWPSDGRTREAAVASVSNEAMFLRRFLARAQIENYDYFLMEAFDQPWKAASEGGVGAYWGVYDVARSPMESSLVGHSGLRAGIHRPVTLRRRRRTGGTPVVIDAAWMPDRGPA